MAVTNAGGKLFICATPQTGPLTGSAYAALTWVEIKGVGKIGETGMSTNMLSYDTWADTVTQKVKGMTDGGAPEIELMRDVLDAGQDALRAAALTNYKYAFKITRNDQITPSTGNNTAYYNLAIVSGPKRPNGRNEDFDLEVFTLGVTAAEVVVDAT